VRGRGEPEANTVFEPAAESKRRAVIVTGASSGIGRALAQVLGSNGHSVGLIARRLPALEAAVRAIEASGGRAVAASADVGDRRALRAAVQLIEEQLGPTDVLIANAGHGTPTYLDPLNIDDVEQMIRVNLMGVIYSIEAVLPRMLARSSGHIVGISSLGAFKGLPGESAYCASKAAVNAYLEGLRIALLRKGVTVTTVCPGFVATDMAPMNSPTPFLMSADAAARRIARVVARQRGGVVRFPLGMSLLTSVIGWLPDALVARLVRVEAAPVPAGASE
jgi:short-subunit dehydrogenase